MATRVRVAMALALPPPPPTPPSPPLGVARVEGDREVVGEAVPAGREGVKEAEGHEEAVLPCNDGVGKEEGLPGLVVAKVEGEAV